MACLLGLSHELIHCILTEAEPADLAALSCTCKDLHAYIQGNKLLHKDVYVKNWDRRDGDQDWEATLHDMVRLDKILASSDISAKQSNLPFVSRQIDSMLRDVGKVPDDSLNIRMLSDRFRDTTNIQAFLTGSGLFSNLDTNASRPSTPESRRLSAKLHCMYGVPIVDCIGGDLAPPRTSPSAFTRLRTQPYQVHTYARSKVYDLREYTRRSLWGPFVSDGSQRVDWEKVEAILVVLGYNLRKYNDRAREPQFPLIWKDPFVGASPYSFQQTGDGNFDSHDESSSDEESGLPRQLTPNIDLLDPYGVTGTWLRVVCFLDYNELYNFNFHNRPDDNKPREPIDTDEGTILIQECWRVTKIEPPGTYDPSKEEAGMDWSGFTGTRLPVVHFAGVSRSLQNSWDPDANSRIRGRGSVRQTPEGEIRWTTFSIFHGEERWRSESVQVGGLQSGRGVIGNWFDKDFDAHGPAGPTAFWKESNEVVDTKF